MQATLHVHVRTTHVCECTCTLVTCTVHVHVGWAVVIIAMLDSLYCANTMCAYTLSNHNYAVVTHWSVCRFTPVHTVHVCQLCSTPTGLVASGILYLFLKK